MRNLYKARINKSLTQKQLADKVDVTQNMISQYECGRREPSIKVMIELAKTLNTSIDYLVGISEENNK